jgi:hypothetical protein
MTNIQRLLKIPTVLLGTALLATSCAGTVGSAGSAGAQGPAGPQGPQGLTGAIGSTGPQGPAGPQGPQGLAGAQGPRGFSGSDGSQGANGKSAYQLYLDLYPGYDDLPNKNQTTWINDLASADLVKTLSLVIQDVGFFANFDELIPVLSFANILTNTYGTLPTGNGYLGQTTSTMTNAYLNEIFFDEDNSSTGYFTDAGLTTALGSTFIVDGNETLHTAFPVNQNVIGQIVKPVVTSGLSNEATLNNAINALWDTEDFLLSNNVYDFSKISPQYLLDMDTAFTFTDDNSNGTRVDEAPIQFKFVIPEGKTFDRSATTPSKVYVGANADAGTFTIGSSDVTSVQLDTNWDDEESLVLFANTNMAYGWRRNYTNGSFDGIVSYVYKVFWTDGTHTLYFLNVKDNDPATIVTGSTTATLAEAGANDGSITATATITILNGVFATPLVKADVTAANLPAGLDYTVTRTSDTVVTIAFTGNASANETADDITDLSFTIVKTKVSGAVANLTTPNITINFADQ